MGSKVQKFKGCIFITMRHFATFSTRKPTAFISPQIWNMVLDNDVAKPAFFTRI